MKKNIKIFGIGAVVLMILLAAVPAVNANQPPVAEAEPDYQSVYVGEEAWFNGSGSYDPDGYITEYRWDFGDQQWGYGPYVTHRYTEPGVYDVYLYVFDEHNASDYDIVYVNVSEPNQLPVASFMYSPAEPVVNEVITFDASASYDPDGYIVSYEWDFGDNNTGLGSIVTHSYSSARDYQVLLTVTDNDEATAQDIQTVHVSEPPIPDMFVYSIDFTKHFANANKVNQLDITVKITDDDFVGVPDAIVYGILEGPDDIYESYQGITDAGGTVTFIYQRLDKHGHPRFLIPGIYTFTVTNVEKADWNYNPAKNLETSDSTTV